ncbi:PTS system D-fructose-specific IIA component (F1P-forming), Frc family (TC 4.A.2.1.4) [Fervidobacterium changbaicum]|uniref:PTS fructose transporter subunit IIA n=1 Tax=Fervidobacterium changbaicum TaxID=310769 RepID=A0ABX5QRV8_9BACT|nr:PTS sugar transporter subunit IIA [Fervidobacterium changbaicum]QAV33196.1 PTS fructose transporter subunit IIA [Fervidobacterium changbaicum]SDH70345.1 PTS system D-fructose-specific IIA component (F1P-forming), Frc family (TC 4.A.2.1.4) [Fervidobacterium changbaicum]
MEIKQLFSPNRVCFDLKSKTKEEIIEELIDILYKDGKLTDKESFKRAVMKREEEFSTGIGMGIAIPHGKDRSVLEPCITFGISRNGVDFESMDGKPAHIFFLISVPDNADDTHLHVLSLISRKLMHEDVREKLYNASSFDDIIKAFE